MEEEYPEKYICPILMDLMLEPVKASDGIIYDKVAIIDWYNKNKTSPYTREPLNNHFEEQKELQNEINKFIKNNNIIVNRDKFDPNIILCPLCKCDKWNSFSNQLIQCNECHKTFLKEKCVHCGFLHILNPIFNGFFICVNCETRNNLVSFQRKRRNNDCVMS